MWSSRAIFSPESGGLRLQDHQLINHFPNHYELTRKDLMYKNVRRYRKEVAKLGVDDARLNFVPKTFILPQDYSLFIEEHRKGNVPTWIFKPIGRAQGKGIFLVNRLAQIRKLAPRTGGVGGGGMGAGAGERSALNQYIICEYLRRPLLIGGRKFDLRIFVVVVSYRPLIAYVSRAGFARFCNVAYSNETTDLSNTEMHLTNVAVQKGSVAYNPR